ncbi:unnamed protein product [Paramecium octaurelia]|uniref:Uncharacterized protein n=1 Tax=Paramecium octaurelia TaxID=43137 RepID=A0A8S1U9Q4_PAROT|nr:unnamed protein product [Paramecium octaurelia]
MMNLENIPKFCLIPFLLSTLFRKVTKLKSSFNFYQIMLLMIDLQSLTDYINTTESYQRYSLIYAIRIIRPTIMFIDLVKDIAKVTMGHFEQRLQSKQFQIQQQPQQINRNKQINRRVQVTNQTKMNHKTTTIIKNDKTTANKIPLIALNLIINQQQYNSQIIDSWSFDKSFSTIFNQRIIIDNDQTQLLLLNLLDLEENQVQLISTQQYRDLIAEYLSKLFG